MKVLVTGGTGVLGREVVNKLRERGHIARVLSRQAGSGEDWIQGDLATGAGLAEAVKGVQGIVHAGSATTKPWKYGATDVEGTRSLLELAGEAGVLHFVYISIVGMEGVAYPYYRHKLRAEAIVERDNVPWSILRATQFHTLMEIFLGTFCRVPGLAMVPLDWQFQPTDPRDVADRLVHVVTGRPAARLPDYGGPEVRNLRSLAESWLQARRLRKRLVNLVLPIKVSRQFAAGRLLCPGHKDGHIDWEQYLEDKYGK